MRNFAFWMKMVPVVMLAVSCGEHSGEQSSTQEEVNEIEVIPKVKEPQAEQDIVDFTEEETGTPITGKQGNPKDVLVTETPLEE